MTMTVSNSKCDLRNHSCQQEMLCAEFGKKTIELFMLMFSVTSYDCVFKWQASIMNPILRS